MAAPLARRLRPVSFTMRYGRLAGIVVTLSLMLETRPCALQGWAQTEPAPATDTRERVRLAPAERDAIRLEMRAMLQGLSDILHGLTAGDLVKVEKAARGAGVASALDAKLGSKLPPPFVQLGLRTHQRLDAVADAVRRGATRDAVLRRVAAVTASCTACHGMYRFDDSR
jgi:hypothetical protein